MQRKLLPLLAVLVLVAGGAIWIGSGRGPSPVPGGGAGSSNPPAGAGGTLPGPSGSAATVEKEGVDERTEALPQAAAAEPAAPAPVPQRDPALPPPGAGVSALYGGSEVFHEFYRDIPGEGRKSRLVQLEEALAEYTDGDPQDRHEFEKYQALKDEAEWLRVHFDD